MVHAPFDDLERKLAYSFANKDLLALALTHSSVKHKKNTSSADHNERLEFLGDRILGLIVAEMLYHSFPEAPEGDLAPRHTALVRKETLAEVAESLDLGLYIRMTKGEEDGGGRSKPSVLADATEALIAAIYLDSDLAGAKTFVTRMLDPFLHRDLTPPKDAKTQLQEWAQGKGHPLPGYETVGRSGPDHAPSFEIKVSVAGGLHATASGASKRLAEQGAAQALLDQIHSGSRK